MDLRVIKTREAIHTAIEQMICELPAEKITVKELTERARIHRKTFYLHYDSIEALYAELLREMADGYYREMDKLSATTSHREANRVFFEFFSCQGEYVQRLVCEPSYRFLCDRFFKEAMERNLALWNPYPNLNEQQLQLVSTYLHTATQELYRAWQRSGRAMPLKEVIDFSGNLLELGVSSLAQ